MAKPTTRKVASKPKVTRSNKNSKNNKSKKKININLSGRQRFGIFVVGFAIIGLIALFAAKAATPTLDSLQPIVISKTAGAQLPIKYDINSIGSSVKYVSTSGNDSNAGTKDSPYKTLSKAVSSSSSNGVVVVRGGTYRDQRNLDITSGKSGLRIVAYPGEVPVFNGATAVSGGWTTEGNNKYIAYTPRPLTDGGGVSFSNTGSKTNLNGDGVGRFADQAWIGDSALKQVSTKEELAAGKFFVDRTNNRLYLISTDASKSGIETSKSSASATERDRFSIVNAPNVTIEGIKIVRYSASAGDYGAITVSAGASNTQIKNVEFAHMPYEGIHYAAGNKGSSVRNVTMSNIGWQSINTDRTDEFTLDSSKITLTDPFDEFSSSPASGALKTSRNRNTTVTNTTITSNKSHGLWFDQSNINTVVANNNLQDNSGSAVFFEISDGLTMVNNYIKSSGGSQAAKLAGSSGLVLVNNTIVGGVDPIGVYTDPRSIPGCSTRSTSNPCQIGSDIQTQYPIPATMDWMPRIDTMINNIVAYPSGSTYCGGTEPLCIMTSHSSGASAPINTIIHKADASRGIPQSVVNGNVYANGTGTLIRVSNPSANYTSLSSWTSALAGSPTNIAGIDANSKSGNSWVNADGSPTSTLVSSQKDAVAVPKDVRINEYVPAGTKYYGALASTTAEPVPETTAPTTPPTTTTPTTPAPVAPTGPSSLNASPASTSQINLTWAAATDTTNFKDYLVYRNGSLVKEGLTTTGYNDTGLTADTSYSYQVKIRNKSDLISSGSPTVSAKTAAPAAPVPVADTTKPTTPSNLSRSLSTNWSNYRYDLVLNWGASQDASGIKEYRVSRNGKLLGSTSNTSYTDGTVAANQLYTYSVVAVDKADPANVSAPASTTAKATCFWIWCSL